MTSTFKLTSAEFKKIFKRPSIFIMAILLVVTILISMAIFDPAILVDKTIVYENASTSIEYYNNFYDDTNINSKKLIDDKYLITDSIIEYYEALNNNTNLLTNYYNDIVTTMDDMMGLENSSLKEQKLKEDLAPNVKYFYDAYTSLDALNKFESITKMSTTKFEYRGYNPKNYYGDDSCASLKTFYSKTTNPNMSANDIIDVYNTNHYKDELKTVLNNGINFVYTTLKGLVIDYQSFYNTYERLNNSSGQSDITNGNFQNHRYNLQLAVNNLLSYLETLTQGDFPIILIDDNVYMDVKLKLEEAKIALNISTNQDTNLSTHENIKNRLQELKLYTTLENLVGLKKSYSEALIEQVHVPQSKIASLKENKAKVDENRNTILSRIDELKTDESISNISHEITNYSLLQESYSQLVNDKLLLEITDDLDASVYQKYQGFGFDKFNKYQFRERVTINEYYIENNSYSNSYLNNFSYNQNSGTETNVYDFMYFALELCTLIIIVFAMMLVCNLITGETESGTIKLLLVRPFRRSKIITAKILATIFFVITFMLFSSIITFVGGYFMYGNTSLSVLSVLNSNTIFTISPLLLMIINILTLILDIIFFVLLALMISILFKNYAASISASLVILIINYAFNILFGGAFWYTLLPGMNLHMFKYFGNSFASSISGTNTIAGFIQSLLITGIDTSMSFPYSIFIYGAYSIIFLAVSYSVFQKRDF